MLEKLFTQSPVMYHNYEITGIGFKPGSEVVTTKSLVEKHLWRRFKDGEPGKLLSLKEVEDTTGVTKRRIAQWNETVTSLAVDASKQALGLDIEEMNPKDAEIILQKVRLVIANTSSQERQLPGITPGIIRDLGILNAHPYDVRQACAAGPFMLNMAIPMLASGIYRNDYALLISSDTLSRITDFSDYATGSLFADAAGALVLRRSNTKRLAYFELESIGELTDYLEIKPGETKISMKGGALFEQILLRVPPLVETLLKNTGISMKDIDFVALHPGSGKMQQSLVKRLHVPHHKTLSILHDHGNSSASSMIGILKKAHESGRLGIDKKILIVGFGAGIEIGAGVIEWSMPNPHEPKKKRFYLSRLGHELIDMLGRPFQNSRIMY